MTAVPTSTFFDVEGPIHVADYGGAEGAPVVVLLHGLGNSHVSWRMFAAELVPDFRVLAVDLPGHGLSPLMGRSTSVVANHDVLGRLILEISADPVTLVGHSMGASLAVLQAAKHPEAVRRMALLAPPMPRSPVQMVPPALAGHVALCAWPWLARVAMARRLERLGPEEYVARGLKLTCASVEEIDPETRRLTVELVESAHAADSHAAYVEAARSMGVLLTRARQYKAAISAVTAPTVVVHGTADRLLPGRGLDQLEALQPGWRTELLEGIGHSPHLEAPGRAAGIVREFMTDRVVAQKAARTCSSVSP